MSRGYQSADALLYAYVEEIHRHASARSASFTVQTGRITALFCAATRRCPGMPRRQSDGWKCSACRKPWHLERVELSRGEIGGRVVGTLREPSGRRMRSLRHGARLRGERHVPRAPGGLAGTRAAELLGDVSAVLDQVAEEDPHAFAAWLLHKLDDAGVRAGRSRELGLRLEALPQRLAELIEGGFLPPTEHELTVYRVRKWIGRSRRRASELYSGRRLGIVGGRPWKGPRAAGGC